MSQVYNLLIPIKFAVDFTNYYFLTLLSNFTCRQERARYYTNRQLAINNPDDYVSMIVDGMDQNKTDLRSLVCYAVLIHVCNNVI